MTGVLALSTAGSADVHPPPQAARTVIKKSERLRRSARMGDDKGCISTPDSMAEVDGTWRSEADREKLSRTVVEQPACELLVTAKTQNVGEQVAGVSGVAPEVG